MCGFSNTKIRDEHVGFYMGSHGGYIEIGDLKYKQHDKDPDKMREFLDKLEEYGTNELATLIVDLINNSEEG